ncbi:unnamed protein product [Paramecium sonneborni]|uniref:Uncharacterized protein n=1 Tax=Paramecium sonneborni TaxID=65129 RepID=A0A8S1REK2_9CILI|nr:unnamed protein product [Paramecium sonneborni]
MIYKSHLQPQIYKQTRRTYLSDTLFSNLIIRRKLIYNWSSRFKIKFWTKQKSWFCKQTINEHSKPVQGLCINQDGNRLISSGEDKIILFMKRSYSNIWEIIQKISEKIYGLRMNFITYEIFSFSPAIYYIISFYSYDQTTKQFPKLKNLSLTTKNT